MAGSRIDRNASGISSSTKSCTWLLLSDVGWCFFKIGITFSLMTPVSARCFPALAVSSTIRVNIALPFSLWNVVGPASESDNGGQSRTAQASGTSYLVFVPNVIPRPAVNSTSFFLLPSTGWLLYRSLKRRFAVIQPFNLVAIPKSPLMR